MERRAFLQVTGTVGAGLVIGFRIPSGQAPEPFAPNAWLRVATDGAVTVTIDKSEMGEGNHTALAMIVAEELDADWSRVHVGPLPDNPAAWSRRMTTGGSTSVSTSWEILRKAGAAARMMLVGAAAQAWGVDAATCRAERGMVLHGASNRRLAYGALAQRARSQPVPEHPPLKDPKEFRLLGTRVRRLDTPEKVDGSAVFGIDVTVPEMLVASIERSPVVGGRVRGFDPAPARAVPGVRHVVQLEGRPWTGTNGAWGIGTEAGVAVVADTYWQAATGRRALRVAWDEGANAALGDIARRLAALDREGAVVARSDGNAPAALTEAARRIEAVYEVPFLHHATMEPMNCTAHVRDGRCDVWAATQNQTRAQEVAAEVAGLPKEAVRIHTTLLGGGFGRRLESDFVAEAVAVSKAVGAPVKVIWSREDDTRHGFYRPATYNRLTAGLDGDGRLVAWTHRIVAPPILVKFGPLEKGLDGTSVDGAANMPYAIPNLLVDQVAADLPVPLGFWRSVGQSQNAYVVECFLDEVAAAANRDPFELRRELLRNKPRHLRALELAAAKAGWGTPLPPGRGRGIAIAEWEPTTCAEVAEVSVAPDGTVRVHRVVCAVDCGPVVNPDTIEAQMESGVVFGLTAALYNEITFERGRVQQGNFHDYPMLRIPEMPVVEVHIVPSTDPIGGIGEPSVPPTAPAVCNAIFAATGKRVRRLPIGAVT